MIKGNFGDLLKQAQEFQKKIDEAKRKLSEVEVTGRSGAGLVEVVMTCNHDVKKVKVSDELLSEEKEVMEDLIAAAFNDAIKKVEVQSKEQLGQAATGMLPPGFKMPSL